MVLETSSPGGQAGSSSRIENYLGFPTGISGQELAARAYHQAQKFGAEMLITKATRLICDRKPYVIEVESGARISARTVVIATGAQYRKLPLENLSRFEGAGVYYGATFVEAQLCGREEEVIVVGGGNSAGQAALYLTRYARRVTLLVRAQSLDAGMSHYLVRQVEATPKLQVRLGTEIVGGGGDGWLKHLVLRDRLKGGEETVDADALFLMIGGHPHGVAATGGRAE